MLSNDQFKNRIKIRRKSHKKKITERERRTIKDFSIDINS